METSLCVRMAVTVRVASEHVSVAGEILFELFLGVTGHRFAVKREFWFCWLRTLVKPCRVGGTRLRTPDSVHVGTDDFLKLSDFVSRHLSH